MIDERFPQPTAADEPAVQVTAPHRVLVVDDNADAAEMIALLLQLDGHDVRVAHDADSALDTALRFLPDIGLFDIGLPGADGYELARRVRRDRRLSMYLVAVTGWGEDEDRLRATEAGFDGHVTKPAEPETLRRAIAGVPHQ